MPSGRSSEGLDSRRSTRGGSSGCAGRWLRLLCSTALFSCSPSGSGRCHSCCGSECSSVAAPSCGSVRRRVCGRCGTMARRLKCGGGSQADLPAMSPAGRHTAAVCMRLRGCGGAQTAGNEQGRSEVCEAQLRDLQTAFKSQYRVVQVSRTSEATDGRAWHLKSACGAGRAANWRTCSLDRDG